MSRFVAVRGWMSGAVLSVTWLLFAAPVVGAAPPWPGGAGTEIGNVGAPGGLPAGYEPSGAVWHPRLGVLFVVGDGGDLSRMDFDGQNVITWSPGGDLEGVTIADSQSDLIYLGVEHPDSVVEFDLSSGTPTGNTWDLTPWMIGPNSRGLEALTYVEGLFYAGLQDDGAIYVFDLQPAGVVNLIEVIPDVFGRDDLSGLDYSPDTQTLYAVHDSFDVLVEMDSDGIFVREYDLPPDNQEGIAIAPNCDDDVARVFVSEDTQAQWRYDTYPVECVAPQVVPALGPIPLAGVFMLLLLVPVAKFAQFMSAHSPFG